MENCSRPNSGKVSRIQFKLSTGIDNQRDKMVAMKTPGLATGPRNLHFMASYFKNENVYKLPIGKYIQRHLRVTRPNFIENRSKVKVTRAHNVYS